MTRGTFLADRSNQTDPGSISRGVGGNAGLSEGPANRRGRGSERGTTNTPHGSSPHSRGRRTAPRVPRPPTVCKGPCAQPKPGAEWFPFLGNPAKQALRHWCVECLGDRGHMPARSVEKWYRDQEAARERAAQARREAAVEQMVEQLVGRAQGDPVFTDALVRAALRTLDPEKFTG